jgi:hypothetical protein
MDRDEILQALRALASRLHARGVVGEMYVVGGAAMALAYSERRSTKDVDAIFEPKMVVYEEAQAVAADLGLPVGRLNDAVKGFLADDPDAHQVLEEPGLRCFVASTRMLLALKILAHRIGEDEDDVRLLAGTLGLRSAEKILAMAEDVYGDRLTPAAASSSRNCSPAVHDSGTIDR